MSENKKTCSFCHKTSDAVDFVIANEGVYICNECVYACTAIIFSETASQKQIATLKDELVEKDKAYQELEVRSYAVAKELREQSRRQDNGWQIIAHDLLERAEKAEADLAALKERVERIKHTADKPFNKGHFCDYRVAIEAIRQQAIRQFVEGK
ncbi:MAG: ClpX C4-type zinc finger protein [Smithella sp.]